MATNFSASAAAASQLPGLDPSKLTITKTTTPKELMDSKDLVFGKNFTGGTAVLMQTIDLYVLTGVFYRSYALR